MDVDHHMTHDLKLQKKQILSDPLSIFSSQSSDDDTSRKNQLSELWAQLQSIKKQGQVIQDKTKIISRQIGEAKKNNRSIEELMSSMQTFSTEKKQLKQQQDNIESQILSFFSIDEDRSSPDAKADKPLSGHHAKTSIDDIDKITVSQLDDEEDEWNDYVSKQSAATIHHLTQWREILKKTYAIECFYFIARDSDNQTVGVLPLTRLKSRLFGDLLVSMPYFQRGGAIADHPLIEQKLMQSANKTAARLGIDHIEYRDDIPRENLPLQDHKVNMILALPESEDELWQGFTPKLRAQIKRPQQLSPQVIIGGKDLLNDFYKVYTRNMRDLGSPAHSKLYVENILDSFPENSWIVVVKLNDRAVSAGLLLAHGDTMEIPLASTIRKANPQSMNMLLYWAVLKHAIRHGYRYFDFGRSSKDAGTYRFKRQWGAQPKQLYWHYWLNKANQMPALNPSNPKYALIIGVWKRLPVMLTRWLGPLVVKNLP